MKRFLTATLCLVASLPLQAATLVWGTGKWGDTWAAAATTNTTPPATLSGTAFKGQSDPAASSTATFAIGLTRDNGKTYLTNASVKDSVEIVGYITPETQHLGQMADIFVVDRVNLAFMMKNQSSVFVSWNGRVPDLVPFREKVVLTENLKVDIFTGTLGTSGDHRIFLGYMTSDGVLRYTPSALRLTITE